MSESRSLQWPSSFTEAKYEDKIPKVETVNPRQGEDIVSAKRHDAQMINI